MMMLMIPFHRNCSNCYFSHHMIFLILFLIFIVVHDGDGDDDDGDDDDDNDDGDDDDDDYNDDGDAQAYDPNMAAYSAMLQSMYGLSIAC